MTQPAGQTEYVPNTELIASQNDQFRRHVCGTFCVETSPPGRVYVTQSVWARGAAFMRAAIAAVGAFEHFCEDNDPDGMHDFGALMIDGERVFWKIDLFETGSHHRWGAERPDDIATTSRVLTIMLASDW